MIISGIECLYQQENKSYPKLLVENSRLMYAIGLPYAIMRFLIRLMQYIIVRFAFVILSKIYKGLINAGIYYSKFTKYKKKKKKELKL